MRWAFFVLSSFAEKLDFNVERFSEMIDILISRKSSSIHHSVSASLEIHYFFLQNTKFTLFISLEILGNLGVGAIALWPRLRRELSRAFGKSRLSLIPRVIRGLN
jgi:hypothetical protein